MKSAFVLGMTLLLAGCGNNDAPGQSGSAKRDQTTPRSVQKDVPMTEAVRSGNPAEWPGVKVYRPKKLDNIHYDSANNMVTDLDTGDRLALTYGHAGGVGQYGFSNEKTGFIAYGGYYEEGGGIYRIASLMSEHGGPHLSRSEFDISRLAELFRARADAALPNHPREVWVVDSRPATPDAINPRTGMPKDKQ